MHTTNTWRIITTDGRTLEVHGRKIVVTDAGALMVLGEGHEPRHIFAVAAWATCEELRPRAREATGSAK